MSTAYQIPGAPGSCLLRCRRWNPPVDLRFTIADLKKAEDEMPVPAVLDPGSAMRFTRQRRVPDAQATIRESQRDSEHSAQGCEERATLGYRSTNSPYPERVASHRSTI
jgi:hypothetical protein